MKTLRNTFGICSQIMDIAYVVIMYSMLVSLGAQGRRTRQEVSMDPAVNPDLLKNAVKYSAKLGDFMDITCPQYDPRVPSDERVQFHMYDLDLISYKKCNLKGQTIILTCDDPLRHNKLTLKFQQRSPNPLGFTFEDGKTYYYIAAPLNSKNCENAFRVEITINKTSQLVEPPIKPVKKEDTVLLTTTTVKHTPTPTTTTTRKVFSPKVTAMKDVGKVDKQTGENHASNNRCTTLVTSLLALITLWLHL